MRVEPYLFFGGRCEEAIEFYKSALGATDATLLRFSETPDKPPFALPPEWDRKIMHASMKIGETTVMASDGMPGEAPAFHGFSLSITAPDEAAGRRLFDALAAGGQVRMPMGKTFFSPCFGMLADRFGVGWMIGVFD